MLGRNFDIISFTSLKTISQMQKQAQLQVRHLPRSRHLVSAWPVNSRVVELTVCRHTVPCSPRLLVCDSCLSSPSQEGLRVLAPRVVGWGSDSSAVRTRSGGQALGWRSQGEGHRVLSQPRLQWSVACPFLWRGALSLRREPHLGRGRGPGAWARGRCYDAGVPGAMTTARPGASPLPRTGSASGWQPAAGGRA